MCKYFQQIHNKGFSFLHCNTLSKNLSLLNDILQFCKEMPSIIAISETKLLDNNWANVCIPGYNFLGTNSPTNAGGVGLYIREHVIFMRRQDLDFNMEGLESCFIEITRQRQKNVIVGCIYRHPSGKLDTFTEILNQKLNHINSLGLEAYIAGDINIDCLKYSSDRPTGEFVDMLFSSGFMPLITKATRITYHCKTLIDHIYTNTPEKVTKSGICVADISDHLPCFGTFSSKLPLENQKKYHRDFSQFSKQKFINDLDEIDFMTLVSPDVNQSMKNIEHTLSKVTDKHAPFKKVSISQRKRLKKPWITNCILVSIKKKQKLFKSHFMSNDPERAKEYKTYKNKLTKIKEIAKKNYFQPQFDMHKGNIKMSWKLIGMLINRKKNKVPHIPKLRYNKCFTDKLNICDKLNEQFTNIGPTLSAQLPA